MEIPVDYTVEDRNLIMAKLEPDEELIWTAKPQPRLFGSGRWLFLLVALVFCFKSCLFFVLYIVNVDVVPPIAWLPVGVALCATVVFLALPRFLRASERKKIYMITNRRALVLHPSRRSVEGEWSGENLLVLDVKLRGKDGVRGDVVLEELVSSSSKGSRPTLKGFLDVENPLEVVELVKECSERGRVLEDKETEMKIRRYAHIPVSAPTGGDEVDAMPWLSSCEQLLWVGHPHVRTWTVGTGIASGIGIILLVVLYFVSDFVLRNVQASALMAGFVCLGFLLVFLIALRLLGASSWLRNRSSKTLYILTDKRAIVVKPHWFTAAMKMVHTWDLESHSVMKIGEDPRRGRYDMIWSYNQNITINDEPLAEGFLDMVSVEIPLAVLAKLQGFHQDNIINS